MAKKPKQEVVRLDKEELFLLFLEGTNQRLTLAEHWFNGDGVRSRFFGFDDTNDCPYFEDILANEAATNTVRSSLAWQTLSALYDYAVDGVADEKDMRGLFDDAENVLEFIGASTFTLLRKPQAAWQRILSRGIARMGLDVGDDLYFEVLAYLSDVDVRTVRNAISAGELVAYKSRDGIDSGFFIKNASARSWLQTRRGFKPTVYRVHTTKSLEGVRTPAEFGAFLAARREALGLDTTGGKLLPMAPGLSTKSLSAVEAGVFDLPLNVVNPIADFYQLERKAFLRCVMRVFFNDYYMAILESQNF